MLVQEQTIVHYLENEAEMRTTITTERISTASSIATLGLSDGQRNYALANLALANVVVAAFVAVAKWLRLR